MKVYSRTQQMLTLSLLAYRGFWDPDRENRNTLAKSIANGLDQLEPLQKQWQLIWGPGSYRYLGAMFDSSMMFVVQHKEEPWRIAIVVRGTNPVEIFDWLFGDFLVHRQVPWHHPEMTGVPDAKLSLSAALGLKILLNMRCEINQQQTENSSIIEFLNQVRSKSLSVAQNFGMSAVRTASRLASSTEIQSITEHLQLLIEKLPGYIELWKLDAQSEKDTTQNLDKPLSDDHVLQMLSLRNNMVKLLNRCLDASGITPVAVLMPEQNESESENQKDTSLLELVTALSAEHGSRLDISVTGHSKGGALAPPLALYLEEKLNGYLSGRLHIFSRKKSAARISCYSYAGPTPGNVAFARYFNHRLGRSFYRYANNLDVACLAWNAESLREVSGLYGDQVKPAEGLQQLINQIADDMQPLDYCHPGKSDRIWKLLRIRSKQRQFIFHGPLHPDYESFMLQWIYQHVNAYIVQLKLQDSLDIASVMGASFLSTLNIEHDIEKA